MYVTVAGECFARWCTTEAQTEVGFSFLGSTALCHLGEKQNHILHRALPRSYVPRPEFSA